MKVDSVAPELTLPQGQLPASRGFNDAFISYGRPDSKGFATKLHSRLIEQGLDIWFDQNDLPLGVDFQNEIDDGLEKSHNFLFIISPHSVNSVYCARELDLAIRRGKRIVPLMHVEQISRELWFERNPEGTEEGWQTYQAAGKHSSFPNMHPVIARLNWVYFREGLDDFDKSLQGLLEIVKRHQGYVHRHTHLLTKALTWERHQKQSRYLLIQEERLQAEDWLRQSFQDEHPPCEPTDLHCEFIGESTKNANNMMTQVFLCHSEKDRSIANRMSRTLMRQGFTVWSQQNDIKTGTELEDALLQGIESTDTVVYLLSRPSLRSKECRRSLDHAFAHNKRVIPVQLERMGSGATQNNRRPRHGLSGIYERLEGAEQIPEIPAQLQNVQVIELLEAGDNTQFQAAMDRLLHTLNEEAAYYAQHKVLLMQALKWERQQRNPSMLMRGYNLRQASIWLETAQRRDRHRPTTLQQDFINESLRQPQGTALDVFISYSRRNSDFARQLNEALQIQGKTTWFDQESLAAGAADFGQEIRRGIEAANHFLFILSPGAVNSAYCSGEVDYAIKLGKRLITVLHQPINPTDLPPALASVQWVDFTQSQGDFNTSFNVLLRALESDPVHMRAHTRLLTRSLEWDQQRRDPSFLLRGSDLQDAEQWLLNSEGKLPQPTYLQHEYINVSRTTESAQQQAEIKRQRFLLRLQQLGIGVIGVVSVLAIAVGGMALQQREQARQQREQARQARQVALREQIASQSITAEALFQSNQRMQALLQSMQAALNLEQHNLSGDTDLKQRVMGALQDAVFWVQERNRISEAHNGIIWELSISPDRQFIASASGDNTVRLWKPDGTAIATLPNDQNRQMYGVSFSPQDDRIASAGEDGYVQTWTSQGQPLRQWQAHDAPIVSTAFSPDGSILATASEDDTVRLWTPDGKLLHTLQGHLGPVRYVSFSPDGKLIATASDDRTIRLWTPEGRWVNTLRGHNAQVLRVRFSPDGQKLISASWDNTVRLWMRNGARIRTIAAHDTLVNDASFSPDGSYLVSASTDKTLKVWTPEGRLITTLVGHDSEIRSIAFLGPQTLVSGGGDRSLRIWQLGHPLLTTLRGHWAALYSAKASPDGQTIATAGADDNIRLWTRDGKLLHTLSGHTSVVWDTTFSPDGNTIASASSDHTVKLWRRDGSLITTLGGPVGPVRDVDFSPDGRWIAAASIDRRIYLWRWDGKTATPYFPKNRIQSDKGLLAVSFSPDGKTLAIGGWDTEVHLWNLQGGLLLHMGGPGHEGGHRGWIYDIAFSPDGQQIATASSDNTIKLWTLQGQLQHTLQSHRDGVTSVQYSRDGQQIITSSLDGTVKIWTTSGDLITTLRGHRSGITDVDLTSDGKSLITASQDQTAQLWDLTVIGRLDRLMDQGCLWLHDYLKTQPDAKQQMRSHCLQ